MKTAKAIVFGLAGLTCLPCSCGNRIETRCQEGKESQEEGEEAQIFLLKLRI